MQRMSKYRVDDDWIDREDDSDYVLRTAINVQNLFATLKELKTRRESDTSGGVTMERVTDERIADMLDGLIYNKPSVIEALKELQARRKAEKEQGHTDNSASEKDSAEATRKRENEINVSWNKIAMNYSHCPYIMFPATDGDDCGSCEGIYAASLRKKYESIAGIPPKNSKEMVLPAPVKHVDGVDVKPWTIKQWFQKINEELDELKDAMLMSVGLSWRPDSDGFKGDGADVRNIAEEAADTITAITSMLEAMGIDEQQRQAAQKLVNEHNRQRGRL